MLRAATATSSAFRYAEVHMQIALGQVDPPRIDPSSLMPHNVTLFKVMIQKVPRDSMFRPMVKTPRDCTKQPTRTHKGILRISQSHTSPPNPYPTN